MNLTFRSAQANDTDFLYRLYCSTRADEVALWGWSAAQADQFLRLQFAAQCRGYALELPDAENWIVRVDGQDAGRMLVRRSGEALLLADLALLSEFRDAGIGTALVRQLQAEAAQAGVPVRLHVLNDSPARRLYTRLGFAPVADDGMYLAMAWQSGAAGETQREGSDAHQSQAAF